MIHALGHAVATGFVAYGAPSPSPSPAKVSPDQVSAGLLGFIVFVFLAGSAFLLWRSMTKQMRKVPDSFDVLNSRADDPDLRKDAPDAQAPPDGKDSPADGVPATDSDTPQEPHTP